MGLLDDYIEDLGVFAFKFKAKAEAKKMGLQGLQEGTDFLAGKCPTHAQSARQLQNLLLIFDNSPTFKWKMLTTCSR